MINSPGWKPAVALSKSAKPDGIPVISFLFFANSSSCS
jgi:hypothetical protein